MYSKESIRQYLDGTLAESERQKLREWFASLTAKEAEAVFEKLNIELEKLDEDELNLLERKLESANNRHPKIVRINTFLKIAAVFLVVCSAGVLFYRNWKFTPLQLAKATYTEWTTPVAKQRKLILPDSTVIWLNAGSRIRFPEKFDGGKREIDLEGEGFFEVKRDAERPFIIHSGDISTQVLGTSFNIKAYPKERLTVSVATGKVHVGDADGDGVFLVAGQAVKYTNDQGFSSVIQTDPQSDAAWRNGILNFDNVPLSEAIHMLERWYGKKVILENRKMEQCMIAGQHTNESFENVIRSLQFILHFEYRYTPEGVVIAGEACEQYEQ